MIEQLKQFTELMAAVEQQARILLAAYDSQQPFVQLACEVNYATKGALTRSYHLVSWPANATHVLVGNPRPTVHLRLIGDKLFVWKSTANDVTNQAIQGEQAELFLHPSNTQLLVATLLYSLTGLSMNVLRPLSASVLPNPLQLS